MAARPSPRQIEFKIGIRRQSFFLLRQTAIGRSDVPVASPEFYINSVRSFRVPLEKKLSPDNVFNPCFMAPVSCGAQLSIGQVPIARLGRQSR